MDRCLALPCQSIRSNVTPTAINLNCNTEGLTLSAPNNRRPRCGVDCGDERTTSEDVSVTRRVRFTDDVFEKVCATVTDGEVISTLGISRPNWIAGIDRDGILVETMRSQNINRGPQLVPAWMINVAWAHLRTHGTLSQKHLLNELNVKRSAFVCALLARFDGVEVESYKPVVLRLTQL